jgi:hypothetical protein
VTPKGDSEVFVCRRVTPAARTGRPPPGKFDKARKEWCAASEAEHPGSPLAPEGSLPRVLEALNPALPNRVVDVYGTEGPWMWSGFTASKLRGFPGLRDSRSVNTASTETAVRHADHGGGGDCAQSPSVETVQRPLASRLSRRTLPFNSLPPVVPGWNHGSKNWNVSRSLPPLRNHLVGWPEGGPVSCSRTPRFTPRYIDSFVI